MKIQVQLDNYYDSDKLSLEKVVCDKQLFVPYNQRPWSWNEKEITKLWNSVMQALGVYYEQDKISDMYQPKNVPTGNPHFFGAFVFSETERGYDVVDGQQRLTAISMIISGIRSITNDRCSNDPVFDVKERAGEIEEECTAWLKFKSGGEFSSRLVTDSVLEKVFHAYVAKPRCTGDRERFVQALGDVENGLDVHRKFISSFLWIYGRLLAVTESIQNNRKLLSFMAAMLDVVSQGFVCILIISKKESFSYEVFSCLNTTGLPLNEADKIKNELFVRTSNDYHDMISKIWSGIINIVPKGDIAEYLRFRHIGLKGPTRKKDLYEDYLRNVIGALRNKELHDEVEHWHEDAQRLSVALLDRDGCLDERTKDVLRELSYYLKLSYARPFLISAMKVFSGDNDKLFGAFRLLVNFLFRVRTVSGIDVSVLEVWVGSLSRSLGPNTTMMDIGNQMRKYHSDELFITTFSEWSEKRKDVQFYALSKIEKHLAKGRGVGLQPYPSSPGQHIEHIMPRSLAGAKTRTHEWAWARDSAGDKLEKHGLYLNRIGNLLILESDINGSGGVSNYDYSAKTTGCYPGGKQRLSYLDSKLFLVEELLREYSQWSFEDIEKRQKRLAKYAVAVWSLKAADI